MSFKKFLSQNLLSLSVFTTSSLLLQFLKQETTFDLDYTLLFFGSSLFLAFSILTFFLQNRAIAHKNPNVFVRTVMLLAISKLLFIASIILIYRTVYPQNLSMPTVLALMGLYMVYTAIDLSETLQLNKRK